MVIRRTLNLKTLVLLISTLACSLAQADHTFGFSHVGRGAADSLTKNADGSYTFIGGGNDVWDANGDFDFAYVQACGDFVSVRVESLEPVARWTKAGVMVRQNLGRENKIGVIRAPLSDDASDKRD